MYVTNKIKKNVTPSHIPFFNDLTENCENNWEIALSMSHFLLEPV